MTSNCGYNIQVYTHFILKLFEKEEGKNEEEKKPETNKMKGLKIHDYHILMQHVLPLFVTLYCQKDEGLRASI